MWFNVALGFLVASWVKLSKAEACYDSLNPIYEAEEAVDDDSVERVYILCRNTTFEIASSFGDDGSPQGGQYPLTLARPNVHVYCGEDGDSANNCILSGGLMQLGFYDEFGANQTATNVIVQGVTFKGARSMNIVAQKEGELSLIDCVFTGNKNVASIYAVPSHIRQLINRRFLSHESLVDAVGVGRNRIALEQNPGRVGVSITRCVFKDNVVWPYSGSSIEGLIVIQGASVTISHSIFLGTTLEDGKATKLEYHILNINGTLSMNNNCFFGNDDRLTPVVIENGTLKASSNSVHRQSTVLPPTGCEFASYGQADKDGFNHTAFTCGKADSLVCTATALKTLSKQPCVEALDEIYYAESALTSDNATRTYVLCPGTSYKIRSLSSSNKDDGSLPIVIGRSNINVLCGVDGSRDNGCELNGGVIQVGIHDEFGKGDISISNAVIHGLTFSGSTSANVLASLPGEILLKECIFKDNSNVASIYIDSEHIPRESTQVSINVIDSFFLNNYIGIAPRQSSGVITNLGGALYLSRNKFFGTKNAAGELVRPAESPHSPPSHDTSPSKFFVGYIVANLGGNLEMRENCFVFNEASIAPVISWAGTVNATWNGGSTTGGGGSCEFLALVTGSDSDVATDHVLTSDVLYSCVAFDGHTCPTLYTIPPSESAEKPRTEAPGSQGSSYFKAASNSLVILACVAAVAIVVYFIGPRLLVRRQSYLNGIISQKAILPDRTVDESIA